MNGSQWLRTGFVAAPLSTDIAVARILTAFGEVLYNQFVRPPGSGGRFESPPLPGRGSQLTLEERRRLRSVSVKRGPEPKLRPPLS